MSTQQSSPTNPPPFRQLFQLFWPAAMAAQSIHVAAKLGIADLLKTPQSVDELAAATSADSDSLLRVMRALKSIGIFAEDEPGRFRNTDLSDCLRSDHPQSVRAWVLFLNSPLLWAAFGKLHEAVLTGETAVERLHGKSFFACMAENPDEAALFNAAMGAGSAMIVPFVVSAYDFSRFDRIVDIGGGEGTLLQGILNANPKLRGVLFDLPAVVANAKVAAEVVGGDFFDSVPAGADAYILKGVIHDWNDTEALRILRNCRRAIDPDGTLLLVEGILNASNQPHPGDFMDVLMLTLTGGRERTESDFRSLLASAGFSLVRVISLGGSSIIEGQPIPS